jgi:hypothetical protein
LKHKLKRYEIIKKTEKEKKKRKKNYEKGPGQRFSLAEEMVHGPTRKILNRYLSLSLSLMRGPHLPGHVIVFLLCPNFTPVTEAPPLISPLKFHLPPAKFVPAPCL